MINSDMHNRFLDVASNMTVNEYIDYLVRLKSENPYITWCDIKNLTNEAYELTYSEEFYRVHNRDKLIEYMKAAESEETDNVIEDFESEESEDYLDIIREETIRL